MITAKMATNWNALQTGSIIIFIDGVEAVELRMTSMSSALFSVKDLNREARIIAGEIVATINKGNKYAQKNSYGWVSLLLQTVWSWFR